VFALSDKWVWDFWFAEDGDEHHLFYLQAPKALGDPELRHSHATVGHAVSADYENWEVLPDALSPGANGSWDDLAIWTGSTLSLDGRWYMLYTGVNRREREFVQRIGLAVSDDLVRWEKHGFNPVLEADGRWYGLYGQHGTRDQAWRDPWAFWREEDQHFHALITARSATGPAQWSGVLGHARSRDLIQWEVLPPLSKPGEFAQVEVPQLVELDDQQVILFSCRAEDQSTERRHRLGDSARTGTFCFIAPGFGGAYRPSEEPVAIDAADALYSGKLIQLRHGEYGFMAFRERGVRGFTGELTDLIPVRVGANGIFVVRGE
jgi:beta-fructofuranosidase